MNEQTELQRKGQAAKQASRKLAVLDTNTKNKALMAMADALMANQEAILAANETDLANAEAKGTSKALMDRLRLTDKRLADMAEGLRQIAALPDPIGEGVDAFCRPNGLEIRKVRVPFGVIGIIYEARPNVTADAAGLCLKSGHAVMLRGGSEAIHSNIAVIETLAEAAYANGIPEGTFQFITTTDRAVVNEMLKLNQYLDVIIPRGGAGLIQPVVNNSTVPVIETGVGICHTYIDETADFDMAEAIACNAKISRPGVCNAMETLLVHEAIADTFLPRLMEAFRKAGVVVRGCARTMAILADAQEAKDEDWATEYHDLILAVRVVRDVEEAIEHIARYTTHHSEAIVTNDYNNARLFQMSVDAAAVYVNASTRFTDGFEFGFGAEIGISTQKLHARGPMGLKELTSVKYLINGNGQIR
ncbi:MAG: glutamate-5-semialdehyde dehydrogenase [Selenomonadales bacterium]|nr:glutamate-5-semialdehyde dehydrogenase [Selenomonadales bacterium]